MEYWRGQMSWPTKRDWRCEICGGGAHFLLWGLGHGICRCDRCHALYKMRDAKDNMVTTPICILKDDYMEPMRKMWLEEGVPYEDLTPETHDKYFSHLTAGD